MLKISSHNQRRSRNLKRFVIKNKNKKFFGLATEKKEKKIKKIKNKRAVFMCV
jgi:hypothetical protein